VAVKDYISISKISTDRDPSALEREGKGYMAWKDDALAALFHNGTPMKFIAFLEFKNGVSRGNHYHRTQRQYLLVVAGDLRSKFILPDAPDDVLELTLTQGDLLYCEPGCVHSYQAVDSSLAIEYSPELYEVDDMVPYPVEWP